MNKPAAKPVIPVNTPTGQRVLTISAFLGALISVFLVGVLIVAYLTRPTPTGELVGAYLAGAVIFLLALLSSLVALALQRAGQSQISAWILLLTLMGIGLVPTFYYTSAGVITALATFELAMLLGLVLIPRNQVIFLISAGVVSLVSSYLFDLYGGNDRPRMMRPEVMYVVGILLVLILLGYIILRFQTFSFRVKVITSFLMVGILSVLGVTAIVVNLSAGSTVQIGAQALTNAAAKTAQSVDTFFEVGLQRIQLEARLSIWAETLRDVNLGREIPASVRLTLFDQKILTEEWLSSDGLSKQHIQTYMLVDTRGKVIAATDQSLVGLILSDEDYIREVIERSKAYSSPVMIQGEHGLLYFSARIVVPRSDALEPDVVGALVARYDASVLSQLLQGSDDLVGASSFPRLVDENGLVLASGRGVDPLYIPSKPADQQLEAPANLKTHPWKVIYSQTQAYFLRPVDNLVRTVQIVGLLVAVATVAAALLISFSIIGPITYLRQAALLVAQGDLTVRSPVKGEDEISELGRSFNLMTERLQHNQAEMEQRVEVRTRDIERRSQQLQAAAEIGRSAATIRDLDTLLKRMAKLISERFDFYHVGIFLVDEAGQFAVLQAANSEGGQRMLSRGHKLAVGQQGIVGYVVSKGRPRIAMDVGADSVYFNNPDLPQTRSEMALPLLRAEYNTNQTGGLGQVVGALDIQSKLPNAFSLEDVAVMQVMADLLAVAIENARLFVESQNALDSLRRVYGDISRTSWQERLQRSALSQSSAVKGYRSLEYGTQTLQPGPTSMAGGGESLNGYRLSLPIKVRDMVVGYVDSVKPAAGDDWTSEERSAINSLVDQIGVALESARLYETSQTQAEKERLVAEITARLQESLDVDAVLRTAVVEIRQTLGLSDVTIVLEEAIQN